MMRSESTSAFGQPRDVNDMRGARSMCSPIVVCWPPRPPARSGDPPTCLRRARVLLFGLHRKARNGHEQFPAHGPRGILPSRIRDRTFLPSFGLHSSPQGQPKGDTRRSFHVLAWGWTELFGCAVQVIDPIRKFNRGKAEIRRPTLRPKRTYLSTCGTICKPSERRAENE